MVFKHFGVNICWNFQNILLFGMLHKVLVQGMRSIKIILYLQWIIKNVCYLNIPWHLRSKLRDSLWSSSLHLRIICKWRFSLSMNSFLVIKSCLLQRPPQSSWAYNMHSRPHRILQHLHSCGKHFKINHLTFPKMLRAQIPYCAQKNQTHLEALGPWCFFSYQA